MKVICSNAFFWSHPLDFKVFNTVGIVWQWLSYQLGPPWVVVWGPSCEVVGAWAPRWCGEHASWGAWVLEPALGLGASAQGPWGAVESQAQLTGEWCVQGAASTWFTVENSQPYTVEVESLHTPQQNTFKLSFTQFLTFNPSKISLF